MFTRGRRRAGTSRWSSEWQSPGSMYQSPLVDCLARVWGEWEVLTEEIERHPHIAHGV